MTFGDHFRHFVICSVLRDFADSCLLTSANISNILGYNFQKSFFSRCAIYFLDVWLRRLNPYRTSCAIYAASFTIYLPPCETRVPQSCTESGSDMDNKKIETAGSRLLKLKLFRIRIELKTFPDPDKIENLPNRWQKFKVFFFNFVVIKTMR